MDLDATETWRWIWLVAGVVFAAGEIVVAGTFFLLPFGIGAFAASAVAFATTSVTASWIVFIAVSVAAFATLVPLGRRLNARSGHTEAGVGAGRWVGRQGVVLVEIPGGAGETGLVRIDREEWRAESLGTDAIAAGSQITVVRVDGTRLVVDTAGQEAPRS